MNVQVCVRSCVCVYTIRMWVRMPLPLHRLLVFLCLVRSRSLSFSESLARSFACSFTHIPHIALDRCVCAPFFFSVFHSFRLCIAFATSDWVSECCRWRRHSHRNFQSNFTDSVSSDFFGSYSYRLLRSIQLWIVLALRLCWSCTFFSSLRIFRINIPI